MQRELPARGKAVRAVRKPRCPCCLHYVWYLDTQSFPGRFNGVALCQSCRRELMQSNLAAYIRTMNSRSRSHLPPTKAGGLRLGDDA